MALAIQFSLKNSNVIISISYKAFFPSRECIGSDFKAVARSSSASFGQKKWKTINWMIGRRSQFELH